ncbi:arfaptin-2-like isoform X2 [Actinia tenebrosa]|uniref:Arfaptin-2-like isoform X2 n=1 Tax=Actinia tenebrosa TaxID=6105 RepID=A0A6P8H054_ACTTE|nr:arfaptin-2-like isoform X2 [Actinia tenebrosa]
MADTRLTEDRDNDIRETDLNGDVIPGAIGPTQPVWQAPPSYNESNTMNQQQVQNSHYGHPGTLVHPAGGQKLEHLKKWSISTYKCTRQYLSERLGKGTKTVDKEIESQVLLLRETQVRYSQMLRLSKQMTNQFQAMLQTQKSLGDTFTDLGMKSPELQDEFSYNSETQRSLVKNGEILLGALNFFNANLETLVHKTMEDSVMTVKAYESARIEYDAYRSDLESIQGVQQTPATAVRIDETKRQFETQKAKFDKLRGDLAIKLRFLEENKVKVMHKQLLLFNNAITAYFSGNKQALESCINEFHIKMKAKEAEHSSFLEH